MKLGTYLIFVCAVTALMFGVLWYERKLERYVEIAVLHRTAPEFSDLLDQVRASVKDLNRTNPQEVRTAGYSVIIVRVLTRLAVSFGIANALAGVVAIMLRPKESVDSSVRPTRANARVADL